MVWTGHVALMGIGAVYSQVWWGNLMERDGLGLHKPTAILSIIIIIIVIILTTCSRILEKLTSLQLFKKLPAFYGTRSLIISFANSRHLSLSWASLIQSIPPHPTSWTSLLILPYHLRLPPKWFLFLRFPHQTPEYASPLHHTTYMPLPSHVSRIYHPNNIWWAVEVMKLLIT
jgi:hypothetical protein